MNDVMQYKDYLASLSYSSEDEVFYGKILGIDDLVSFEGSSVKELKKAFQEAVEDYIETCKQIGKDPNKTIKAPLMFVLAPICIGMQLYMPLCKIFHSMIL
jgi:predicted HicB family RNase H-like nuclease